VTELAPTSTLPPGPEPELSIVLATLNERPNLPELFRRIRAQPLPSFEVLVVDDGSTDGTREFLIEEARNDPRLRPVFHDGKQTTLRAQCQAIAVARGKFVVVMDSDLQHPPELLPAMWNQLATGSALVVASRYAPGGTPGTRSVRRLLISRGAQILAESALPPARRVSDPVSGYFALRRDVWTGLNPLYRGYKLLLFVLVMAEGRPVSEVGFRFEPRSVGTSKLTEGPAFLRLFLVELVLASRLRSTLRRSRARGHAAPVESGA
jgi:dolichol-phosphate mannosyltransferase